MNRALGGELLAQNRDHLSTEHLQLLEAGACDCSADVGSKADYRLLCYNVEHV